MLRSYRPILGILLLTLISVNASDISWEDHFNALDERHWEIIPRSASIQLADTLSAANHLLRISPGPKSQHYLASRDYFTNGECEIRFKVRIPRKGNLFYYLGFHAYKPWGKSMCWLLIHNETANFIISTSTGKKFKKKLCNIRSGQYYTLKITQGNGRIVAMLDNHNLVIEDPSLLEKNAMPLFLSAYTSADAPHQAELQIDYAKVSGGEIERKMKKRPLNNMEKKTLAMESSPLVKMQAGANTYSIDLEGGCHWGQITYGKTPILDSKVFMPCFAVRINGNIFYSHDFQINKIEKGNRQAIIKFRRPEEKITAWLYLKTNGTGDLRTKLKLRNDSNLAMKIQSIFPIIGSVSPDNDWENAEYFFPWRSGLLGQPTARLMTEYGGLGWMQIMLVRNPVSGNGLYFYPEDTTGKFKGMIFNKINKNNLTEVEHTESVVKDAIPQMNLLERSSGIAAAYYYAIRNLSPMQEENTPETVFHAYQGSWKIPLRRYSRWMRGNLAPVKSPRWFKDSFTWKNSHPPYYYSKAEKRYLGAEKLVGGEDSVQWAFWDDYIEYPRERKMSMIERYQFGDFIVNRSRGGAQALKEEFSRIRNKGTNCTLYIDHRFCHPDTQCGQRHGKQWGTCDENQKYYGYTSSKDLYLMCFYDQDKWVSHLSNVCTRLIKTTGVQGIYLDELGIAFPCYNHLHEHYRKGAYPVDPPSLGKSLSTVRNAMLSADPEAALMTEHAGSDFLTQYFDGSWDQTFYSRFDFAEKYFSRYRLCFFRFLFPHFKISAWGPSKEHIKRGFFNGIGLDLGGDSDVKAQLLAGRVLKENGDAVNSLSPSALVPTSHPDLLANRFATSEKIFHTFFNISSSPIQGGCLEQVPISWHAVELLRDNEIQLNAQREIQLPIPENNVAGVAFFPETLQIQKNDKNLVITYPPDCQKKVIICFDKDNSHLLAPPTKTLVFKPGNGRIELPLPSPSRKLIIKLYKDNYLIDERIIK